MRTLGIDSIVASASNLYNEPMHLRQRNSWWLFIGVIGVSVLGWFTNTFSPKELFFRAIFFLIIFITTTSLFFYVLNNVRRALLVGIGVVSFLILRYVGLREVFYAILLLASLVSLEVFFQKR